MKDHDIRSCRIRSVISPVGRVRRGGSLAGLLGGTCRNRTLGPRTYTIDSDERARSGFAVVEPGVSSPSLRATQARAEAPSTRRLAGVLPRGTRPRIRCCRITFRHHRTSRRRGQPPTGVRPGVSGRGRHGPRQRETAPGPSHCLREVAAAIRRRGRRRDGTWSGRVAGENGASATARYPGYIVSSWSWRSVYRRVSSSSSTSS